MCGISGIVYRDRSRAASLNELKRMCAVLRHRGPDDEGVFLHENVGLGVTRLSIIDLVSGHQPISNEDGSISVIFNGEIYNYRELRRNLETEGHKFKTDSDTETIVHAYEEYGEDCVIKLNGMFAFAIWDRPEQKLLLARDRLGVKPLYYFSDEHRLVFASELKAILQCRQVPRTIDYEALDAFLTFEYVPAPLSIFAKIKKMLPGHLLVWQNGQISIRKYWDLHLTTTKGGEKELSHTLYGLLQDAVRMRLISDVPLGALLSGGIDSSSIVCLMSEIMDRPVKTFSIGFHDPSYNELAHARTIAKHFSTDYHELTVEPGMIMNLVPDLITHLDEPLADVSIFPTYLVSRLARQHVSVVLSGDGGDELFAGYDWYVADRIDSYYRQLPPIIKNRWLPRLTARVHPTSRKKGLVNKFKRFVDGADFPPSLRHFRWNCFVSEQDKRHLYTEDLSRSVDHAVTCARFTGYLDAHQGADPLWREQFADIKTYLPDDILAKVDRMSMANSLEARTPFLDYRVVEFVMGLPSHLKLNGLTTKYILKRCMAERLPRAILRRTKQGFSIPMKNWLKRELRPILEDILSPEHINQDGWFNPAYVEKLKTDHFQGIANRSHQLWSLMVLHIWRDAYLRD